MHDAAQNVEVPDGRGLRYQMDARLDDHGRATLCIECRFDGIEDLAVGEFEARHNPGH